MYKYQWMFVLSCISVFKSCFAHLGQNYSVASGIIAIIMTLWAVYKHNDKSIIDAAINDNAFIQQSNFTTNIKRIPLSKGNMSLQFGGKGRCKSKG